MNTRIRQAPWRRMLLLAALLGGGTVSVVTLAQEEVAPAEVTAPVAEATPATQNTSGASAVAPASEEAPAAEAPVAAAPAVSIKPRPSEIARLSSKSLLLGITQAGDKLITVGDRGNILLSSDGNNWTQAISPTNVTLTAVAFADASNGWAVGHDAVILHTTDSGKTWQLQNFQPELNKPLFGIFPIDAQNAYAVGAYGLFLATQDGGAHWTAVEAGPITADGLHLNAMIRLNNGDLFIAGEVGLIGVYGIDQKAVA
ncbi:MAG: WD40/YVTN/BNR-like repeat-containing protein, partial [Nevskiales bacterium]